MQVARQCWLEMEMAWRGGGELPKLGLRDRSYQDAGIQKRELERRSMLRPRGSWLFLLPNKHTEVYSSL